MEVKIGITDSPRELIFNSAQTPSEVEKLITDALSKDSGVVALTDEKGRRFLVQSARRPSRPGKWHVGQPAPDERDGAFHRVILGDRPVVVQPVPG